MRNKNILLFVTLFLIGGCSSPVDYVSLTLDEIWRAESELGSPCFRGYVKNDGTATAYNCTIRLILYGDEGKHEFLELAEGWGDELKMIEPGGKAYFEVPFYKVNHEDVASWEPLITWEE